MKKIRKLYIAPIALMCLPFCGAWTVVPINAETRFVDVVAVSSRSVERIDYNTRTVLKDTNTPNNVPTYFQGFSSTMPNACGPVAGAIVVGYYDKYYENLIPDWQSYFPSTGRYRGQNMTNVIPLIQDLYNRMETNVAGPGVSEAEFKAGLTSYVVDKGFNISYQHIWNGYSFDYSTFGQAVADNKVSALLVLESDVYELYLGDGYDNLTTTHLSGNHIMVAYGEYEVKYETDNGTVVDKYIKVATGQSSTLLALYKVGSYIDTSYVVSIF